MKLITCILLGALLGILLCIIGCIGLMATADAGGQLPRRSLIITIDVDRREELFAQLRGFADKHGFEILIREVNVHPDGIFIAMYRKNLIILANDVPESPTKIDIGFYDRYPAFPVSPETADDLFDDLRAFISKIPNVTVTEGQ